MTTMHGHRVRKANVARRIVALEALLALDGAKPTSTEVLRWRASHGVGGYCLWAFCYLVAQRPQR